MLKKYREAPDIMDVGYERVPHAVIGLGLVLGVGLLGEVLFVLPSPYVTSPSFVANSVSSVLFVAILLGIGYRLLRDGFSPRRYRRIAGWVGSGLSLFVVLLAMFTTNSGFPLIGYFSALRWAATVGSGGGLLVGFFEARSIERAVAAEEARIRAEEARRHNERLEEFASIISHDLRNPLNVADGYLELARAELPNENLDRAATALERMDRIIEETLVLAREGRVIEDPESVELVELVEQSWQNVDTEQAKLAVEGAATIQADGARVEQLLENLFRNAIEHGGADVTVRVGQLEDGFYIEDDGQGIPEDERGSVLESGYSTKTDGTGFGLAIVKQIATAHGWTLAVTESEAGGARFEITGVTVEMSTSADTHRAAEAA